MRMKYFLKKYDEYRNGILKIEKPIEDFSNLEMSNVRGFEDPVEQRKAIQSLERKERRENNLGSQVPINSRQSCPIYHPTLSAATEKCWLSNW